MQAQHQRNIKSGKEYDYLFPHAKGEEITIKWDADVYDTLRFIPKMVLETLNDTKALSKKLKGNTLYETCENIWDFVYYHIQYHYDKEGVEQVRRPARSWMDRVRGVDCDCYTVFISSILTNLHIPHTYRITKYKNKDNFQHIYPIVPTTDGKYITIDCVVDQFNYEEPFTDKKDSPMKLTYLNGIEDTQEENPSLMAIMPSNIKDLPDFQDFDGFGKINIGKAIKDAAHIVNRENPATALLRLGVLACMKLNMFQIPKNLRYAYLTDAQAEAKNIDLNKLHKLQSILHKMEDIFYGAGGQLENLKKAILTGKGNKDHSISGMEDYDENTPLRQLLSGIYEDEYVNAGQEVNGLGDPATGAAITAATGAMAAIAEVIKKLGSILKGGVSQALAPTPATTTTPPTTTPATTTPTTTTTNPAAVRKAAPDATTVVDTTTTSTTTTTTPAVIDPNAPQLTFSEKAKAWVKENPAGTTVMGLAVVSALIYGGVKLHEHHTKHSSKPALSGAPHHKPKRKKARGKRNKYKKTAVALL
jgi:hypothetical protein